ncbi:MAG: CYTH domain-containing protein [Gemmatimonadales bacterium]
MVEREVKAVMADPAAVRAALLARGARLTFAGRMTDRRYDRDGSLAAKDEVLRVRGYVGDDGSRRAVVAWKGPVRIEDGYKLRPEHELRADDAEAADRLVQSLGYRPVSVIDRRVEYYEVAGAVARLEWYPRMDALIEVEGTAAAIESAIAATGLPRDAFTADALDAFAARFEARTGQAAVLEAARLEAGAEVR